MFCSGSLSLSFSWFTALLAETERLGQERVDVQRQAEKDRVGLAGRLRSLELALDEHESRAQQQEEQHRTQTEDLQQHISALEKQLKHYRQFMDVSTRNKKNKKMLYRKLTFRQQACPTGSRGGVRLQLVVCFKKKKKNAQALLECTQSRFATV